MPTASRIAAACAALTALAVSPPALAQYYYQPSPDYYHNDTASGTIAGGALGAVTGAIVGGKSDRGEGALIGAGIGAVTGNLLGRAKDRADQQQTYAGVAAVNHLNQQAAASAVTNYDLLEMTRAGVSEEVIISTMRSRGARLDLGPQALISLKQSGVSDRVVLAAQQMNGAPAYSSAPVPVVTPVPRPVIVRPVYDHCWYDHWHHHHWHHHHRRSHAHFHFDF